MTTAQPYAPPAIAPDPRATGIIGFMRAMVSNPVSAIPAKAYERPMTVSTVGGNPVAFLCDPALLEEVLIRRATDFPKSVVDERVFRPAFGASLLVAEGEDWRWKRRLAAPYFAPAALARLVPGMVAPFEALARTWRARNSADPVDVSDAMTRATFAVISATLFTDQDEIDFSALSAAITDYLTPISWTIGLASLKAPAWLPHPGKARIRHGQRRMRELVAELIAARRRSGETYDDICADLMAARDPETGRPLTDDDLVDMLLTLVAAGHETSANALTWALFCLAEQPALQDELRAEAMAVAGERRIGAEDLPALTRTEAFLKETMRLFPPAPIMARRTTRPETLGGYDFPVGTTLFIAPYAIHRNRQLWPEPDRFDITRFLGGAARAIGRTTYMPFGAGPRICIGGTFAMMEMVGALATLVRGLRFAASDETRCEPIQRITLRPKDGLRLAAEAA